MKVVDYSFGLLFMLLLLFCCFWLDGDILSFSAAQDFITLPVISFCVAGAAGCAVFDDKRAKCWGFAGYYGRTLNLGDAANELGNNLPFVNLESTPSISKIYCGNSFFCFKLESGDMKCIGNNFYGQCGIGSTSNPVGHVSGHVGNNLPLVNLGTGLKVMDMGLGSAHACIKVTGDDIKCFGKNDRGQLGYGNIQNIGQDLAAMGDALVTVNLGTNAKVDKVFGALYGDFSCAILSAPVASVGRIKCWGRNHGGQLGYGSLFTTSENRGDAAGEMGDVLPLVNLGTESKVKNMALNAASACAILVNDNLKCWGNGHAGQLASGSSSSITATGNSIPVVALDAGKKISQIVGGNGHYCLVYDDQLTAKCFGSNNLGQLGQGNNQNYGDTSATTIPNIPAIDFGTGSTTVTSIYVGDAFTCALFGNSGIKCFGFNSNGQLCIGSTTNIGTSPSDMGTNLKYAVLFSPTKSPTKAPTKAPTKSPTPPTSSPSKSPSSTPTKSPTQPTSSPTRNPTPPTKNPTLNPTRKPTANGFFGPQESSLPGGSAKSLDLYLLIDVSRVYEKNNVHCVKYKLMSGASPLSCFDLMMDYVTETVKAASSSIGYYVDSAKDKGLRVAAYLISCLDSQRTPTSTLLFGLTGDSSIIMNALNQARTNTDVSLSELATCPLQGFYDIVQGLENNWAISDQRPYKAVITFTDGLVHDASANTGNALINAVTAIRNRCTQSLVVVPFRYTTGSTQEIQQTLSLQILTGNNVVGATAEAKIAPWIGIPKIGEQITTLLLSNVVGKSKCSSSTSYSTSDKYWCGYNRKPLCDARTSCEFVTGGAGCRKIESMNGCGGYLNQPLCDADVNCEWKSTKCGRKPEETDCNALVLQSFCTSRSKFCTWNSSTSKCVALSG